MVQASEATSQTRVVEERIGRGSGSPEAPTDWRMHMGWWWRTKRQVVGPGAL